MEQVAHWRLVKSQSLITDAVLNHKYRGNGTKDDPYLVEFIPNDPRNPMNWPDWKKWFITMSVAFATLAVAFVSTAYSGAIKQVIQEFGASQEVATLGISLFVLGFAVGPLLWAPMSELYGRQALFIGTYAVLTAFNAGAAGSQNIESLVIMRFLAGTFGASPLTNAGGVIADMFPANQRGLGLSVFAAAPFLGPVIGPVVGGFVGETEGWRWVEGIMAIFTGALLIFGIFTIPETYAPVLLQRRAAALSKKTGKHYISMLVKRQGKLTPAAAFKKALTRPWILLFSEPIVLIISIYMAIIYGTLYMLFGAFPIVFQENRGWSQGIGGLAFCGVAVGILAGVAYNIIDNKRYTRVEREHGGEAPPEARLPPAIVASIALPVGMFWFAWTNYPSIHWIVCIMGTAPFGFGMVLVFLALMNYLIDAYTIYAASVLAANSVLRSLFGAAFPLFTSQMYHNLGIHWASSIPAFLALACLPFPLLFYMYGERIRMRCKFAREAHDTMEQLKKTITQVEREEKERTGDV
jgi:multidrug resistance protein